MTKAELIDLHQTQADNPMWWEYDEDSIHIHDWRSYAQHFRAVWDTLSLEARCAVVATCQPFADAEEWD